MSGYGNPNGSSTTTHHSNPNPVEEQCGVCHQVFNSVEALINHCETHVREKKNMDFQNNFIRVQNQAALRAQRLFGFVPIQNQHPNIQQRLMQQPPAVAAAQQINQRAAAAANPHAFDEHDQS